MPTEISRTPCGSSFALNARSRSSGAAAALHPLVGRTFLRQIATVHVEPGELTLVLNSGLRLRLGDASDLRLKLAVGRRVAADVDGSAIYADLTMPQRPVVGYILMSEIHP